MAIKAENLDHPLVFLFVVTLGVVSFMAIIGWGLSSVGLTGPLGLFKGGVVQS